MTAVIAAVFERAAPSWSRKNGNHAAAVRGPCSITAPPFVVEARNMTERRYYRLHRQLRFHTSYVGHEHADLTVEIDRRIGLMAACYNRMFASELYDVANATLSVMVRMVRPPDWSRRCPLKRVTWYPNAKHYLLLLLLLFSH